MKSAHFINKRKNGQLIGLQTINAKDHLYSSEAWSISEADAEALKDGWIYLHASKSEGSTFGGRVTAIELVEPKDEGRYRIHFQAKTEARDKPWAGQVHAMAWWSGVIDNSETT